ncbi:hypothetical protein [uncultured Flavobacterium sp.]|uniref:hypothetical protein n=1 Tax=uncultured Flavobacterium sp. TaxID=165435 RepID=UPI002594FA65|nr:hypothetical protein [uncultured Flavobacterium sp.]
MTTNNNLNNGQSPQQDVEGYVAFHLPRKIPLAILFAFLIQIAIGIWAVSSFYFGQKELQNQFRDNVATLTQQLNDLKSTIYTRNEASIQFEIIRHENMRQDQELRELRDKIGNGRHR